MGWLPGSSCDAVSTLVAGNRDGCVAGMRSVLQCAYTQWVEFGSSQACKVALKGTYKFRYGGHRQTGATKCKEIRKKCAKHNFGATFKEFQ